MLDIEKLREIVGPEAKDWTESHLRQLDRDMDEIAEILLELYRERKRRSVKREVDGLSMPG